MDKVCAVILAAGHGKRMKSAMPKVMCEVLFKPMVSWVADSAAKAGLKNVCAVIGPEGGIVKKILPEGFETAVQQERKGTGHAVMAAADFIRGGDFSRVAILNGDAPLIAPEDIARSLEAHIKEGNAVTVMTAELSDPTGYGRIVRGEDGVSAIVEQRDADTETKLIKEINSGAFWFEADFLLKALESLEPSNAQGEYYLTDTVAYAVKNGYKAGACVVSANAALGANDRKGLSQLNQTALAKILDMHMENGVNIPFADGIIIGPDAEIGPDTTILPGTVIKGQTKVGSFCEIGPNSYLDSAEIKDNCRVISTYVEKSVLESGVKIGPMSNVRPGSHIMDGAKIGDFVEIKNSNIGAATSISHLTYVGDSDVGRGCNFGCGVVTSNYDGKNKHRTEIGDNVFIGGNTNLIAPVKMGSGSYSAAGTTVTEDVPEDALVIGRSRQTVKEGWAKGKYGKK